MSKVADDLPHPTFVAGVELTHWNGVPIRRAIEVNAAGNAGSNEAARFARGLDSLTIRPLMRLAAPDEEWVAVRYVDRGGADRELRVDWKVWAPGDPGTLPMPDDALASRAAVGYDVEVDSVNVAKKLLFAPAAVRAEVRARSAVGARRGRCGLSRDHIAVGAAGEPVDTPSGRFGYIRVFTFMVNDADEFVAEFVRLTDQLPPDGLIVDVRNNGGGLIYAAEQLLQTLTRAVIEPRPQFVTTPLSLTSCAATRRRPSIRRSTCRHGRLRWTPRRAHRLGVLDAHSITPARAGQRRRAALPTGRVVLVTDARAYSATDMFAAPDSRITGSARCSACTTTPAPVAPTYGRTSCCGG